MKVAAVIFSVLLLNGVHYFCADIAHAQANINDGTAFGISAAAETGENDIISRGEDLTAVVIPDGFTEHTGDKNERRPPDFYIPLEGEGDLDEFTVHRSDQVSFVYDKKTDRYVQRVNVPEGEHYGMEMNYFINGMERGVASGVDEVHMRWKQYIPRHWTTAPGHGMKFPGIGHRDRHGWGGRRSDGTGGWSVRTGLRDMPARDDSVSVIFEVYHMEMGTWGTMYHWQGNELGSVVSRGEWVEMEIYVRVNTPGVDDGIIRGRVNGEQRFEKTDLRFRAEGYEQYDIREIIWHIYHGGAPPSPVDQHIYFRDLEIWVGGL